MEAPSKVTEIAVLNHSAFSCLWPNHQLLGEYGLQLGKEKVSGGGICHAWTSVVPAVIPMGDAGTRRLPLPNKETYLLKGDLLIPFR